MSRRHSHAEIKEALEACRGGVYLAAERLDMWPSGVYARINASPELKHLKDRFEGRRTDVAELKLEQAITNGEPWAIQFQLKTKGRTRGYVERQEVETHGHLSLEVEPKAGPELEKAIKRVMDVLASGGPADPPGPDDGLPPGFRAAH